MLKERENLEARQKVETAHSLRLKQRQEEAEKLSMQEKQKQDQLKEMTREKAELLDKLQSQWGSHSTEIVENEKHALEPNKVADEDDKTQERPLKRRRGLKKNQNSNNAESFPDSAMAIDSDNEDFI